MLWSEWWIWAAFAVVMVILEVILPTYIFLGFAVGAGITGAILWLGGPLAATVAGSMSWTLVTFAIVSLVSWVTLRSVLGVRKTQVKMFDEDINDN